MSFTWLTEEQVLAIHDEVLKQGRGLAGHDESRLGSAVGFPQQRYAYEVPEPDVIDIAACYAYAFCRFHPFSDGNKRTAFVLMKTWLALHGCDCRVSNEDLIELMVLMAEGHIEWQELSELLHGRRSPEIFLRIVRQLIQIDFDDP